MNRAFAAALGLAAAALSAIVPAPARAQCPRWLHGPEQGWSGLDSTAFAQLTWDPDGAGPGRPVQVVGGLFSFANEVNASRIATWDGSRWAALGAGLTGTGSVVYALTEYNGGVIAAGKFTAAGGVSARNIAFWNGSAWSALGPGLNNDVLAVTVYDGELIAAGQFTASGATPVASIAAWDGSAWRALGAGLTGVARALCVYQDQLYVAGSITAAGGNPAGRIARWDGAAWQTLGPGAGLNNTAHALTIFQGQLVAAGDFTRADTVDASKVARWDGSAWSAFPGAGPPRNSVYALAAHGDDLIIGGRFTRSLGGGVGYYISRWRDGVWSEYGSLLGFVRSIGIFPDPEGGPGAVLAGTEDGACLYRRAETEDWIAVGDGINGAVLAGLEWRGRHVMAGEFYQTGHQETGPVAEWTGTGWATMGAQDLIGDVRDLTEYQGDLVAVGFFHFIGTGYNTVARYDGTAWTHFGPGTPPGDGFGMAAMTYQGDLIIGGNFTQFAGLTVNGLARWDGSAWHSFGTGTDGTVLKLGVYNGELIVAGSFSMIDGTPVSNIARWDGATWRPLGTGIPAGVSDMTLHGADLVVVGGFTTAGDVAANHVARWDGAAWHAVGNGIPGTFASIRAVASYQGQLYAGGAHTSQFGVPQITILSRWNGVAWIDMGSQIGSSLLYPGLVMSFHLAGPELILGGAFTATGGSPSVYWGRRTDSGTPWIADDPDDTTAAQGGEARLSVTPASGYEPLTVTWMRSGAPVIDGPGGASPGGGVVTGSTTTDLLITGVQLSDAGPYTAAIETPCGADISTPATLTVSGPGCPADLTGDGLVDFTDYLEFLNLYDAGDLRVDFNGDGLVDFADYLEFLNLYEAGC